MKLMEEHGTWYVPTIIAGDSSPHKALSGLLSARRWPPRPRRSARSYLNPAGRAYKARVKIAFGTRCRCLSHTAKTRTSSN